jgi:suppressor for copper-sensitivity B
VTYQACDDSSCLPPVTAEVTLAVSIGEAGAPTHEEIFAGASAGGASAGGKPAASGAGPGGLGAAGDGRSLAAILFLALVGGLILNAMPCVLPVLSLKVFGLVKSAGEGRESVVAGSLATGAGILLSFWALAGAALAAKAAGAAVGWGVQFQNPVFVAALAVVMVLFSLNLWGLFEIPLPAFLARAGAAGSRQGTAGHFASGLFATLMATPCSAPFLGTALGFALGQSAPVVLAVFTAVGLGMALPYLALAAVPRAASLLPRPGAWMDTLKGILGFLLAGAVLWLLYVLGSQVSPVRLAGVEAGLLGLALFVWLRQRGERLPAARRLATAGVAAAVAATLWLSAGADSAAGRGLTASTGRIAWAPFDREKAQTLAADGRLVFVDVTADWCFTCKFNEKLVLDTPEVAAAFRRHDVVAMKADWTNRDDSIAEYLSSFGRYGIPFYALYRPGAEPHVFSELLTKGAVLTALDEAGARVAER